jgi:hypothetical protein
MTRIDRLTIVVPGRDPAQAAQLGREVAARLAAELPRTGGHHARVSVTPADPRAAARAVKRQLGTGGPR